MMFRLRVAAGAAVIVGSLFATAVAAKSDPKPLELANIVKPAEGEGYFDDVFALDDGGKRLCALRTDGATFAKLDIIDLATAKVTKSFDLPGKTLVPDRLELLPDGKGVVLIARDKQNPTARLIGFFDGYTRVLGERPGAYNKAEDVRSPPRMLVMDALSGKVANETEIANIEGWAVTGILRREHPGRSLFVELNQDASGVDVVDAMGKKQPAALAVPFRMYDPKSLRVEEGPAPGALTFGIAVDPLNPDAIKRKKTDLPMLDVYTADVGQGTVTLRGRVFTPRPVTWKTAGDKLVVLKRFKSFSRGGDELQIYDLR